MENTQFKIMLIEDDQIYGKPLGHYLSKNYPIDLQRFTSGLDALIKLSQRDYEADLIILDYNLGDITGDDVIQALMSFNKNSKVIILSSQTDSDVVHRLFKLNIYEYLTKGDYVIRNLDQTIPLLIDAEDKSSSFGSLSF